MKVKYEKQSSQKRSLLWLIGALLAMALCFNHALTGTHTDTVLSVVKVVASVDDPSNPTSQFYSAYKESFGLLDDVTDQSWALMKERVKNRQNHLNPEQPWQASDKSNRWYQDNVSYNKHSLLLCASTHCE